MRLIAYPLMICGTFLLTGCDPVTEVVPSTEALFCDVEEPRIFEQHVVDWRVENDIDNLRLDIKTNTTWDRECRNAG